MTVILYSCYDDKGNYSYEDIDEISIAGMPDTLVTVFKNTDTLKVVPELKHTLAAEAESMSILGWLSRKRIKPVMSSNMRLVKRKI